MSEDHMQGDAPETDETGDGTGDGRRRRGGARTVLLTGLVVLVAFAVGSTAVTVLSDDGGPTEGGVAIQVGPPLDDRVAPSAREPLPASTLAGFGGEDADLVDLTAYRGQPLVVNFWASWCAPCVQEMPDFQQFSQELGATVPLLGVNVQDAPANAQAFVDELGITYDLAIDPAGELYAEVGAFGMPTTLFVTPEGTIVYRHTGPLDADELRTLVRDHLDVDPR
jgi:cytochrome c biogenesis protein CcmG, thiol:disulfide interchange protein DsbE